MSENERRSEEDYGEMYDPDGGMKNPPSGVDSTLEQLDELGHQLRVGIEDKIYISIGPRLVDELYQDSARFGRLFDEDEYLKELIDGCCLGQEYYQQTSEEKMTIVASPDEQDRHKAQQKQDVREQIEQVKEKKFEKMQQLRERERVVNEQGNPVPTSRLGDVRGRHESGDSE